MSLLPGKPYPLGATPVEGGVNFAVYSAHATAVHVCLFDGPEDAAPSRTCSLVERTGSVWHGIVPGVESGQLYGLRVDGPYAPHEGHRFNPNKLLLDPYAREVARPPVWNEALFGYASGNDDTSFDDMDSAPFAPLGRVVETPSHAQLTPGPDIPWEKTIIYETHVRGATMQHPGVPEAERGTYAGLASDAMINYFQELGVTAIQLLPVQAKFSEHHLNEKGLTNYWGYNTLAYFAPEPTYAANPDRALEEFQTMVDRLHHAGLEVIMDVVFNHTAEGSRLGPTLSFRGLDNLVYYLAREDNPRMLHNFTGTGNTLDVRQPVVLRLIMDSLRFWAETMGVDGFRFDLATVLARTGQRVDMDGPFFMLLEQDPILRSKKMIAEPWDLGPEGYRLGAFQSPWREWNGKFRDDVRMFWSGEERRTKHFATRMAGNTDLFRSRRPSASINFITAHDGYTLADLVSYRHKHNHANGEQNRDGHEPNHSNNWGVEGPTDDPGIKATRNAVSRSLMSSLLLAQGVPMILGGDEMGRTQQGNNNAYCQDNSISWFDWSEDHVDGDFLAFTQALIQLRKKHPLLAQRRFLNTDGSAHATWWHASGRSMHEGDWNNPHERVTALEISASDSDASVFLAFNPTGDACQISLPPGDWAVEVPFTDVARIDSGVLHLNSHSVCLLAHGHADEERHRS